MLASLNHIDLRFGPAQRQLILDRVARSRPERLTGSRVASIDTIDGYRFRLEDGSWSLIRFSGTEPLLRVYCETSSEVRVAALLDETRRLTGV